MLPLLTLVSCVKRERISNEKLCVYLRQRSRSHDESCVIEYFMMITHEPDYMQ
jgi:hypothetical protein